MMWFILAVDRKESKGCYAVMTDAKTIQIFLPDGQPRGVRIAEITTRIVQAVVVPRTQLERVMQRPEIGHVAVYFLFGDTDDQAKPIVYIGQTEDLRGRLKNHNANKEFWRTAVLIISKTHSFTQAHIRFLEWFCLAKARETGRYAIDNGNEGSKPYVPEPMEADLMDAFETASILLSTVGHPVFESVVTPAKQVDERAIFYCVGPQADAKGEMVEDGFVVFAGSTARLDIVPSAQGSFVVTGREKLQGNGVLIEDNGSLRFIENYLFQSPSGAAMVVLGRTANGWNEWKNSDGRTLHELKRMQSETDKEG